MADVTLAGTAAAAVPVPPAGAQALYADTTSGLLSSKNPAGNASPIAPNQSNVASSAASAAINTAETIITPAFQIPANFLQVGTTYRITVSGTCTSTVANLSTFTLRIGPNGTTADTSIATITCTAAASGTTIPFTATFLVTIRSIGAGGTVMGSGMIVNSGVTGISSNGVGGGGATATAAVNTTVANFLELTYKSAATTTTCTFQQAVIELAKY